VDPAMIEGTGHGKLRDIALPAFHSPRPYAFVATILILATAALHVLYTLNSSALGTQVLSGVPATPVQLRFLDGMQIASFITAVVALVGWSIWLSRAVTAMPALGLGYPAATGLTAFAENFLPGLNLLRVPALVRDVVRRLEPGQNRGEALIFAAWIGLLGGFLVPRIGAVAAGLSADSPETLLRSQLPILGVSTGLVLVGAIFLVALIWWIEARIARRRDAQLAAIDAAVAGADAEIAETTEEGVSVEYATAAGPAGEVASEPEPAPPEPQPVAAFGPIEPSEPIEASERPAAPEPEPDPLPEPAVGPRASNAAGPTNGGAPHLTIRIGNHGMLHAEMGGEIEAVMLEDLTAYGHALAEAGGTAELIVDGTDGMVDLIARRAQRILAEAGIDAPIPD
jgi:hypothetical protein